LPETIFEINKQNHLILKAHRFDTVGETSECASEILADEDWSIINFLDLIASAMSDDRVYHTSEERIAAICHTMVVLSQYDASQEHELLSDLENVRQLLSLWLLHNLCMPDALSKSSPRIAAQKALLARLSDVERLRPLVPTLQEVDAEAQAHDRFLRTVAENVRRGTDSCVFVDQRVEGYVGRRAVLLGDGALRGQRVFRTGQGYIGKGPKSICRGDSIWIVPGAYVPFILREGKRGQYAFVGHCYIHGIMDGEMFESLKTREGETVTIV
jgi:hypothetical protein